MVIGKKYLGSTEITNTNKAKVEVIYNIRNVRYAPNGFRFFINIHNSVYKNMRRC